MRCLMEMRVERHRLAFNSLGWVSACGPRASSCPFGSGEAWRSLPFPGMPMFNMCHRQGGQVCKGHGSLPSTGLLRRALCR